jgi:hypothetical protein
MRTRRVNTLRGYQAAERNCLSVSGSANFQASRAAPVTPHQPLRHIWDEQGAEMAITIERDSS